MSVMPEPAPRQPIADADNWAVPPLTGPKDPETAQAAMTPQRSVTLRILLLSTLLIFVNCYWVIEVEGIWHSNHATAMSLFWNTTFFLLLLVLLNIFVLKKHVPRFAFSQGELITCSPWGSRGFGRNSARLHMRWQAT